MKYLYLILALVLLSLPACSLAEDVPPHLGAVLPTAAMTQRARPSLLEATAVMEADPLEAGLFIIPEAGGAITVTALNGTTGSLISGAGVTLYAFDGMSMVYSQTMTTSANGLSVFQDVKMPAETLFMAALEYQGILYASDPLTVEQVGRLPSLEVMAFESTTDASQLVIERLHVLFDFAEPGKVDIIEIFVVSNATDRTVIALHEGGAVLFFSVPDEARNMQFQDGEMGDRFLSMPGGIADTSPVRPGVSQVMFAYQLPYQNKLALEVPLGFWVKSVMVLLPDERVKIESDTLGFEGVRDLEGVAYQIYSAESLEAGDSLEIGLSGRPKISSVKLATDTRLNLLVGLVALTAAVLIAGVWLYSNSRDQGELEGVSGLEEETDPNTLMDAIIALDDLHKAGNLPDGAYQERRSRLKACLVEIYYQNDQL